MPSSEQEQDRHCDPEVGTSQINVCIDNPVLSDEQLDALGFSREDLMNDRETGVRAMLSIVAELALKQRWTAWLMAEGAPFQSERAAYKNAFNGLIPFDDDILSYVQLGVTYKF